LEVEAEELVNYAMYNLVDPFQLLNFGVVRLIGVTPNGTTRDGQMTCKDEIKLFPMLIAECDDMV
jgi:hypothetical protein